MRFLVTNDDGIYAPGLWALVKELIKVGEVIVVAPDREQSAIGTALTLHHPLRVQKVKAEVSGVETWAVGGTPGDSVIMGLSIFVKDKIDLVISGINNGPNIGDDVMISGRWVRLCRHSYTEFRRWPYLSMKSIVCTLKMPRKSPPC